MKTLTEIRNAQAKCATALAKELVENLRYDGRKLSAKKNTSLTAEDVKRWDNRILMMLDEAYKIYYDCRTKGLNVENAKPNYAPVYDELKKLLEMVGAVSEHNMYATEMAGLIIVGASAKKGAEKSDALKEAEAEKKEAEETLENATEENFEELNAKVEEAKAKVKELIDAPDNKTSIKGKASLTTFAKEIENYIAGEICGQAIKSPAQIEAEREAKKEAQRAKNKARRAEKRKAAKAAKAAEVKTEIATEAEAEVKTEA